MSDIAIILPVYNGGEYVKLAVESVLQQTYKDFEFYIIDDCSTDKSWSYLNSLSDPRIRLLQNEVNRGLFYNLNLLIKSSSTGVIKLWSQDDIMYPECIEKVMTFYQKNPQVGFIYTGRDYIDENGTLIVKDFVDRTPEIIPTLLHARIALYTGSIAGNIANVAISREAINKVGLFREDMKISGDFDMWVRLAQYYPVGFINEPLIQLRDHKNQLSRQETFYIYHLKEDVQVYNRLLGYIPDNTREEGKKMLRNYKLMFYYTLMLKSFLKGKWRTGAKFWKTLSSFDSMGLLTISFVKNMLFNGKRKSGNFIKDNSFLFGQYDKNAII